ncbi:hypothetical protein FJY69_09345 [candidate division WOR-3 bacterium]|nr:hypothetical protein [candidate division WOR-3 bacterium]
MNIRKSIAVLVVLAGLLSAAEGPEGWIVPFAAAYQPDVGGFNAKFSSAGLPEARTRHFGWGIEVRSLAGGLLVGPLFFRTWDDIENDSFQVRTDATGILGEVGLKVPLGSMLTIVPMVGLGGLSQSFSLRERTNQVSLDTLLSSPGRTAGLSPGMKLAGLAALELDLAVRTVSGRYGVALRGGYLYSPMSLSWKLNNGAEVTGTPVTHLGGPFFSVGLLILPEPQVTGANP